MVKKKFNIDVYGQDYHYWEGESMEKMIKKVRKEFEITVGINLDGVTGLFIWRDDVMIILIETQEDKLLQDSILIHEITHATFQLLESRGVPINIENDEAFAYLHQAIYLKCKK